MCCRYYILPKAVEWDPIREEAEHARVMRRFRETGAELVASGEARPTDVVPVLATDREGGKSVFPMRWGFRLEGAKPTLLINARAETAAQKPTFRDAWAAHRCAVPASGYYEWKRAASVGAGITSPARRGGGPASRPVEGCRPPEGEGPEMQIAKCKVQNEGAADGKRSASIKYAVSDPDTPIIWLCGLYRIEQGLPVFVILTREPGAELGAIHDRMPLILPAEAARAWVDPKQRPEELLPFAVTQLKALKAG